METTKIENGKNADELSQIFKDNNTEFKYTNAYSKEEVIENFMLLEQDKEILVSDYPYGFLRTDIKYSVETTKRGGRFVSQTQNPKTGAWNKPKKSTYDDIMLLVVNDVGHVTRLSLDYNSHISKINEFERLFSDNLNDQQKSMLKCIKAHNKIMEKVTFSVEVQGYE